MTTDFRVVDAFVPEPNRLRARLAQVVSVQSDYTITIRLAGTTEDIPGVNYLGSVTPRAGAGIWVLTDGRDLFAFGMMANDTTRTLAPRASRSTTQTIADGTDTAITFDAVQSDSWACWDVGNAARLTAPITGRYMAVGTVQFAANGTGFRTAFIEKTATSTVGRMQVATAAPGSPTWVTVTSQPFDMTAGSDYIRLMVRQNSGAALDVINSSTFAPSLSLIYLGP